MSSALARKIGPYFYSDGYLGKKTFATGGTPRSFTILISSAYDAGVIGPEINGIVVLDDDTRTVVLDRHAKAQTGYFGPTDHQKDEFDRILNMDWTAFTTFCRTNPRFRKGSLPDANAAKPHEGRAPVSAKVIYPKRAKPQDKDCPYDFKLSTKRDIVAYLSGHSFHDTDGRGYEFAPSWNIKVGLIDATGAKFKDEFKFDEKFDRRWKEMVENDESLFWTACEDGLRTYTEGEFTIYPGDNQGEYKFGTSGRSGGHLVLTECMGTKTVFRGRPEYIEWLETEASDAQLVELYKACVTCDKDLAEPGKEIEYQYANLRMNQEERWSSERAELPEDDRKAIEAAEADGGRLYDDKRGDWYAENEAGEAVGPFESEVEAATAWVKRNDPEIEGPSA